METGKRVCPVLPGGKEGNQEHVVSACSAQVSVSREARGSSGNLVGEESRSHPVRGWYAMFVLYVMRRGLCNILSVKVTKIRLAV